MLQSNDSNKDKPNLSIETKTVTEKIRKLSIYTLRTNTSQIIEKRWNCRDESGRGLWITRTKPWRETKNWHWVDQHGLSHKRLNPNFVLHLETFLISGHLKEALDLLNNLKRCNKCISMYSRTLDYEPEDNSVMNQRIIVIKP